MTKSRDARPISVLFLLILIFSWTAPGSAASSPIQPWGPMSEIEAAARKEGKLVIYVGAGYTTRDAEREISRIFQQRYGIDIEWTNMSAQEIPVRVAAEQRTNQNVADLVMIGFSGNYTALKPRGLIAPILAPSTLQKGVWRLEPSLYTPQDRDWLHTKLAVSPTLLINTKLIPRGEEPGSYQDLLNPKWRGKIVLESPGHGGSGSGWFTATYRTLGLDYMRALANQVVLVPKPPDPPDAVGRGQYPIAIAAIIQRALPLRNEGAPLKFVHPKEGDYLTQAGISFVRSAPHPNAAKLFLNWFYTQEGQTVFGKTAGVISLRKDVAQDYLPEDLRYVEGAPVMEIDLQDLLDTEKNQRVRRLAKEIFEDKK